MSWATPIGVLAPGAFIGIFQLPPDGQVNPVHVGVGLGIGQGLVLGAMIGVLLVAIVAWYEIRTRRGST